MSAVSELNKPVFLETHSLSKLLKSTAPSDCTVDESTIEAKVSQSFALIDFNQYQDQILRKELEDIFYCIERNKEIIVSIKDKGGGFVSKDIKRGLHRPLFVSGSGDIFINVEEIPPNRTIDPTKGIFKTLGRTIQYGSSSMWTFASIERAYVIKRFKLSSSKCMTITKDIMKKVCYNEHFVGSLLKGERNVVQYHEVFYFVENGVKKQGIYMPYYDGGHLSKAQDSEDSPLSFYRIAKWALRGLSAIHAKGILHKDIKDGNVVLNNEETPKGRRKVPYILDFGTATHSDRMDDFHHLLGTGLIQAPEVWAFDKEKDPKKKAELLSKITTKIDIYSLGLLLGELHLKMAPEYDRAKDQTNNNYRDWKEPEDPDSFEHLIWAMTRDNPDDRPTSAEAITFIKRLLGTLKHIK